MTELFNSIVVLFQDALSFFYGFTVTIGYPNYGLAIIILTIVIKTVLYPLTVKQVKSMKAMAELAPRMKVLQEKYKNNKEKLNAETAKLYQESGINPLAGCLPLLVQMPVLIALFWAISGYSYVSNPGFLWIENLSQNGDKYYILPLLAAITTYLSTKQTSFDSTQANQMKMMLWFMPLFVGYITTTFPAGLGLYWVVSNIAQMGQQWWLNRKPAGQGGK